MKEAIFSLILQILMVSAIGRAQVTDDFSDGDFNYNPRWQGDSLHFEVNSSKQLHLKWTGNDTSFLATWGTWVPEIEWNFWIKLSFNTSVNNFMKVYLTADRMELDQSLNGSFLQVGGGNDSLYIMKQTGLTSQMLFHFPDVSTVHSTNTLRIKITCDATGLWNAWVDASGGQNFIEEGTWVDTTSPTLFWFGFWCKYTSSNATKCYMDDIYIGPVVRDTIPPSLSALMIPDSMHLSLRFSEDLEQTEALNCTNYTLMGSLNHPEMISVTSGSPCELMLHFGTPFQEQVMDTLMITNLVDLAGNRMPDTLVPFTLFEPGAYDILIHEVMMDPEPTVGLPPVEFIELYNQTGFSVDLSGWFLDIGSTRKTFPSVIIPANGFLLLARDSSLSGYGQTVSLFTSGSSLANEGTTLVLRNSRLQIIHTMTYTPEWIDEEWKSDGGWSLEMIDPANPCGCGDNWSVAEDPRGGTPGGTNSVYRINPDLNPPEVLRSFLVGDTVWEIRFSEPIDTTNPGSPWLWSLASNGMHPEFLFFVSPGYRSLRLDFAESFTDGSVFTLNGSPVITDCAGNPMKTPVITEAALPEQIEREDIIINEVLHNPYSGSSRFVELYNRSDKVVDIRELALLVSDTGVYTGTEGAIPILGEPYLMFPFDFVALCRNEESVKEDYFTPNPHHVLEISTFPQMKDGSGAIQLIRSWDEELIDGMEYHTGMHYPLLSSVEGVSLERISPDRPATDPSNWHSAGENRGYATPAFENSQWLDPDVTEDGILLIPSLFSPDNDGHDDVVSIHLTLAETGFQASIVICDATGRIIKRLKSNTLLGTDNEFSWDGIRDDKVKASMGIYLVQIELIDPNGVVKKFRKPLVVAGNL